MPVFDLFSKRQKRRRGDDPDMLRYDHFPPPLRVQISQIMKQILGDSEQYYDTYGVGPRVQKSYEAIVIILRREYGVDRLVASSTRISDEFLGELDGFVRSEGDIERVLDAVELIARVIDSIARHGTHLGYQNEAKAAGEAIDELNSRFKEHGVGYEFASREMIRIDSTFIHADAVKPTLILLRDASFQGAEEEFLLAYEHYRKGSNKEAINEALKALESTMKSICAKRKWGGQATETATASKLLQICFDNGLIPVFWQTHFTALRTTLEAGVPTARNKLSGHGQGAKSIPIPDYLAGYVLHLTASAILFLIKSERELKSDIIQ